MLIIEYTDGTYVNLGTIPVCNHIYGEWVTGLEATCTSIGYKYHTCTVCGNVEYEFTEATGHIADEYTYDSIYHYYYCTECGTYLREAHYYNNNNICNLCGYEETVVYEGSEGLEYTLSDDETYYIVSGIGTCTDTDIVIPSAYKGLPVQSIGDFAFLACASFTSITIPDSVTSIGEEAFFDSSLTSITIGNDITSIGSKGFYGCSLLTSVYYSGIADEWSNISGISNSYINDYGATLYYYSGEEPDFTDGNNYWHYVDGEIVVWTETE